MTAKQEHAQPFEAVQALLALFNKVKMLTLSTGVPKIPKKRSVTAPLPLPSAIDHHYYHWIRAKLHNGGE